MGNQKSQEWRLLGPNQKQTRLPNINPGKKIYFVHEMYFIFPQKVFKKRSHLRELQMASL